MAFANARVSTEPRSAALLRKVTISWLPISSLVMYRWLQPFVWISPPSRHCPLVMKCLLLGHRQTGRRGSNGGGARVNFLASRVQGVAMATSNQYFNLVQTGKSSWVAVPIQNTTIGESQTSEDLFHEAASNHITFTERFPRLTIAMVAVMILAATLTTEVEVLRGAGFFWQ